MRLRRKQTAISRARIVINVSIVLILMVFVISIVVVITRHPTASLTEAHDLSPLLHFSF